MFVTLMLHFVGRLPRQFKLVQVSLPALEVIAEALKRNLGDCTWNTAKISSELRRLVNDDVQELSKCAYGQ